jgi:excisionase family DNA binding protein
VTLEEVAVRLHCSTKTVRRRIASGELRASRVARGVWVITDEDLASYLDAAANRPRDIQPITTTTAAAPLRARPDRPRRRGTGGDGRLTVTSDMGRAA